MAAVLYFRVLTHVTHADLYVQLKKGIASLCHSGSGSLSSAISAPRGRPSCACKSLFRLSNRRRESLDMKPSGPSSLRRYRQEAASSLSRKSYSFIPLWIIRVALRSWSPLKLCIVRLEKTHRFAFKTMRSWRDRAGALNSTC